MSHLAADKLSQAAPETADKLLAVLTSRQTPTSPATNLGRGFAACRLSSPSGRALELAPPPFDRPIGKGSRKWPRSVDRAMHRRALPLAAGHLRTAEYQAFLARVAAGRTRSCRGESKESEPYNNYTQLFPACVMNVLLPNRCRMNALDRGRVIPFRKNRRPRNKQLGPRLRTSARRMRIHSAVYLQQRIAIFP